MEDSLDRYLETCLKAARAGGAVLLDWAGRFAAREKGPADLVTEADLATNHETARSSEEPLTPITEH